MKNILSLSDCAHDTGGKCHEKKYSRWIILQIDCNKSTDIHAKEDKLMEREGEWPKGNVLKLNPTCRHKCTGSGLGGVTAADGLNLKVMFFCHAIMLIQPSPYGVPVGVSEAAARSSGKVHFMQLLFHVTKHLPPAVSESPQSCTVFIKVKVHRYKMQLRILVLNVRLSYINPRKPWWTLMRWRLWCQCVGVDMASSEVLYRSQKMPNNLQFTVVITVSVCFTSTQLRWNCGWSQRQVRLSNFQLLTSTKSNLNHKTLVCLYRNIWSERDVANS